MNDEDKAQMKRAFELISSWLKTLNPQQADDVWMYLDGADISELIAVVAPLAASYKD